MDSDLPSSFRLGDALTLPSISALDAHDGEVDYTLRLFDSEGKLVKTNGRILLEKEGIWYCIVKAEDLSGNASTAIYEIKVGNVEKSRAIEKQETTTKKVGCGSNMNAELLLWLPVLAASSIILITKRKKKLQ